MARPKGSQFNNCSCGLSSTVERSLWQGEIEGSIPLARSGWKKDLVNADWAIPGQVFHPAVQYWECA